MANATDNVYVNVIANTQGFTDGINSAIRPLNTFMRLMGSATIVGAMAAVLKRVASAASEAEKAYAKLYPESQKVVGSLANWNITMEDLKIKQGEVVTKILTPLRAAFLELIDPIGQATFELRGLNDELNKTYYKYMSAATKKMLEMRDAQKALTDAIADQKKASEDLYLAQKARTSLMSNAPTATQRYLARQQGGEVIAEKIRAYDEQLAKYNARIVELQDILYVSGLLVQEIPRWMKDQVKPTKEATVAIDGLTISLEGLYDYLWKINSFGGIATPIESINGQLAAYEEIVTALGYIGGTVGDEAVKNVEKLAKAAAKAAKEQDDFALYSGMMIDMATAMGEAFASGDVIGGIRAIAQQLTSMLTTIALEAAASAAIAQNWPMVAFWLGIAGVSAFAGGALGGLGGGWSGGGGVELPRMASGGIVTRPTLALIGESGPEAVVPLGGGGAGGVTINVQGSVWQTEDLARAVAGAMGRW